MITGVKIDLSEEYMTHVIVSGVTIDPCEEYMTHVIGNFMQREFLQNKY